MPLAVTAYDAVKALHIMAVLAAFGLPLSYPMLLPYLRRAHPRAMPSVHDAQFRMTQRLVAPGTVLVFVFGAYLASRQHLWGEAWVDVPIAIVAIIGVVGGAYMGPNSGRLAELARRDVEASPAGGAVTWAADHEALYKRVMQVELLLGILVLVAIFFMAAKPFA
jgi:uncharacterized membrane protein